MIKTYRVILQDTDGIAICSNGHKVPYSKSDVVANEGCVKCSEGREAISLVRSKVFDYLHCDCGCNVSSADIYPGSDGFLSYL